MAAIMLWVAIGALIVGLFTLAAILDLVFGQT